MTDITSQNDLGIFLSGLATPFYHINPNLTLFFIGSSRFSYNTTGPNEGTLILLNGMQFVCNRVEAKNSSAQANSFTANLEFSFVNNNDVQDTAILSIPFNLDFVPPGHLNI